MEISDAFPGEPGPALNRGQLSALLQPHHVMPGAVPGGGLLIRTEDAAAWIGSLRAYPNGFAFSLSVRLREGPGGRPRSPRPSPYWQHGLLRPAAPDAVLRLGIQYADGQRAGTGGRRGRWFDDLHDDRRLRLTEQEGSGSDSDWNAWFWVSPLPPAGPVTLLATWPDAGVAEQRLELDGAAIREAAARSVELWPVEALLDDGPDGRDPQPEAGGAGAFDHDTGGRDAPGRGTPGHDTPGPEAD